MPSPPRYMPYRTAAAAFQIGLRPFDARLWLDVSPGYADYMPAKRARLAAETQRYFRALPSSQVAQLELFEQVVAHLLADHGAAFRGDGATLHGLIDGQRHDLGASDAAPLLRLSQFIEEDFVILQEVEGRMIITAACNAYTSSGRIIASVGGAMPFAHEPVPTLNTALGPRIDRILANLKEGQPSERFNWLLTGIGALLFPPQAHAANQEAAQHVARALAEDPTQCGATLWIRTERQTLVKLPRSGAVAFSIHTYSDPLSAIAGDRESLEGMRAALASYSEDRLAYAAMTSLRDPALAWIESRLAS